MGSPPPRKSCAPPRTRLSTARAKRRRRRRLRQRKRQNAMALFQYKALQLDGSLAEGQLEAGGRAEAFRQMEQRGLKPINLSEKSSGKSGSAGAAVPAISFGSGKVSAKMLENFTRLLSSLLAAGVPLSRALTILYRETSSPAASGKW